MSDNLLSPRQKEIYEQFVATFDEELAVLHKRKDLIRTWRALKIEQNIRKANRAIKKRKL